MERTALHDAVAGKRQVVSYGKVVLYCSGRGSILSCDMWNQKWR